MKSTSQNRIPWTPFEFKVYRLLKEKEIRLRTLILAVSGGADSVALLRTFASLAAALKIELHVAHIHHGHTTIGGDGAEITNTFRDRSESFVRDLAQKHGLPFHTVRLQNTSQDEASLRKFRYQFFTELKIECGAEMVATAHHQNDLLESRLMRLMRGTGLEGLESMSILKGDRLRPFLHLTRLEIEHYLRFCAQDFLVDPSRKDLRSFVRHTWLPLIDKRLPGASAGMGRSLELVLRDGSRRGDYRVEREFLKWVRIWVEGAKIDRRVFGLWNQRDQRRGLRHFIHGLGVRNYTQSHVLEVLKHLDKDQNVHTFKTGGLNWQVDAYFIAASILPL